MKIEDYEFDAEVDCAYWESCQEDAYKQGWTNALEKLVSVCEEVDKCEFAMFSLCLIKEIAEKLDVEDNMINCNECTAPTEACNYCEQDTTPIVFDEEPETTCKDGVCEIKWGDD